MAFSALARIACSFIFVLAFAIGCESTKPSWQTDVSVLDAHLASISSESRSPSLEHFENIGRRGVGTEMMVITDGAGGMVDLKPEADTVQYRVNESLKGQAVTWEFALAQDELNMLGTIALTPDLGFDMSRSFSEAEPGEVPHLQMIMLKSPTRAEGARSLKAGDRIIVQGTIGDASANSGFMVPAYDGPVAIYHLQNVGHPAFWIGLVDASITRAP